MAHRGLLVHQALLVLGNPVLQEPAEPLARTVQVGQVVYPERVVLRALMGPMAQVALMVATGRVERRGQVVQMAVMVPPGHQAKKEIQEARAAMERPGLREVLALPGVMVQAEHQE